MSWLLKITAICCRCIYLKTEASRLDYVRRNQKSCRVELYQGLMDPVQNLADHQGMSAGKFVILPSSFQGSPRAMQQSYQDALAIIAKYGKPDLFLTFTTNPKWPDIVENHKDLRIDQTW